MDSGYHKLITFRFQQKIAVDLTPVYKLTSAWPPVSWTHETREDIIAKLKQYLIKRIQTREEMQANIQKKSEYAIY